MQIPRGQHARAAGGDPQQVGRALFINREERIEHRGDEQRAAFVRLGLGFVIARVRFVGNPLAVFHASDRAA